MTEQAAEMNGVKLFQAHADKRCQDVERSVEAGLLGPMATVSDELEKLGSWIEGMTESILREDGPAHGAARQEAATAREEELKVEKEVLAPRHEELVHRLNSLQWTHHQDPVFLLDTYTSRRDEIFQSRTAVIDPVKQVDATIRNWKKSIHEFSNWWKRAQQ